MYCAVIGDIKNSKEINDRLEVQKKLNLLLQKINKQFQDEIASDFVITLGDEFQGLLIRPGKLLEIIETIKTSINPVNVRFGIGIGDIYTEINRTMAIGADGPAYYNARDMIDKIKKNEKSKMSTETEIMLCSCKKSDSLINSVFSLIAFIEKKWSKRQREIIIDLLTNGDNQRKAAERLDIIQSSVQRGLKNSGYYNYLSAKETITNYLKEYWMCTDD